MYISTITIISCIAFIITGCIGIWLKVRLDPTPDTLLIGLLKWVPTIGIGSIYALNVFTGRVPHSLFSYLIIAGFIFCAIGDFFLKLKTNAFVPGLIGFFIGYSLFSAALFTTFQFTVIWVIITFILGIINYIQFKTMIIPKDMVIPIIAYFILQTILVSAGSSAMIYGCTHPVHNAITIGFVQFLATWFMYASDSFIGHNLFRSKMTVLAEQIGVDLLYFIGLSLLTISVTL